MPISGAPTRSQNRMGVTGHRLRGAGHVYTGPRCEAGREGRLDVTQSIQEKALEWGSGGRDPAPVSLGSALRTAVTPGCTGTPGSRRLQSAGSSALGWARGAAPSPPGKQPLLCPARAQAGVPALGSQFPSCLVEPPLPMRHQGLPAPPCPDLHPGLPALPRVQLPAPGSHIPTPCPLHLQGVRPRRREGLEGRGHSPGQQHMAAARSRKSMVAFMVETAGTGRSVQLQRTLLQQTSLRESRCRRSTLPGCGTQAPPPPPPKPSVWRPRLGVINCRMINCELQGRLWIAHKLAAAEGTRAGQGQPWGMPRGGAAPWFVGRRTPRPLCKGGQARRYPAGRPPGTNTAPAPRLACYGET